MSAARAIAATDNNPRPRTRILAVFADGKLRREIFEISRGMADFVQAAFSIDAAMDICAESQFDVLLLVGERHHLVDAQRIIGLGGWAAEMPIVAVCAGSLDLAEARSAGLSVVIPDVEAPMAVAGALRGSLMTDARAPTWWVD